MENTDSGDQTKKKRDPVNFRYDGLNLDFLKMMAELAHYAGNKYGRENPDGLSNYRDARLDGEKGPINHIFEHLRQYQTGEPHDHFTDPIYHLVAIAYNTMMEAYYVRRYGYIASPLNLRSLTWAEKLVQNCGLEDKLDKGMEKVTQALDEMKRKETMPIDGGLSPVLPRWFHSWFSCNSDCQICEAARKVEEEEKEQAEKEGKSNV